MIGSAVAALALVASTATAQAAEGEGLEARGSVEQVHVTGATAGKRVLLLHKGNRVDVRRAGSLGGVVFRRVAPGRGYRVQEKDGPRSGKLRVLTGRSKPPSNKIYNQQLPAGGYGYMTTRDGTKLSLTVHLPGPPSNGPYPTLLEYSGYGYANPEGPQSGLGSPLGTMLGYAVVDVNMRGTGCSGGAFDFFERLQSLDGYDLIETIARQPWVKGKVGMMGISYGGISQLFVGATRPPSLAAITPISVIDGPQTTLYPGGILNTGFALEWAKDRDEGAKPAGPNSGQAWAWKRIQQGDEVCKANQALHTEAVNTVNRTRRNDHYRPKVADPVTPAKFVHKIDVPVFLACQWTDEQTGGYCPNLASRFTGTKRKWFTFTNGTHTDALIPETFNRWYDFLELYVAKRKPELPPNLKQLAPALYQLIMGVNGVQVPDDPIQQQPDYDSAKAAFEAQPPVRILFENGAGSGPFKPVPAFERSFSRFPPKAAAARSWYLSPGSRLRGRPKGGGADVFRWDPGARSATSFSGDSGAGPNGIWTDSPGYRWTQNPKGYALSYTTGRLKRDTAVLGSGEVQAWVRSRARNVDLQATVTEVRPDGKETFVQSGWLRTAARKMNRRESSLGHPVPSMRKRDGKTLPRGRWVKVRIPLYYQGHIYREASRVRVMISAPGGDLPIWAFDEARPAGKPWVAVARGRERPSRLVLPVVPKLEASTPLPACPALRGQPCREFAPYENRRFADR